MPATRELDPGASPAHFFGAEVRRARTEAGMTLADLAATVPCDASTVSRIEAGALSPGQRFANACDEAFPQMGGWFTRFYHDSRTWAGPHPPWFRNWVEIERRATVIRWWEPLLIPGLLQTPDYARAVLGWGPDDGGDLDERVAARMDRQRIFDRDSPPEVWVLLGEPVLGYLRRVSRCHAQADRAPGRDGRPAADHDPGRSPSGQAPMAGCPGRSPSAPTTPPRPSSTWKPASRGWSSATLD